MKEIIHEGRRRDSAWNREVSGQDVAKCARVHQFGQSQISRRYGIIILKALTLSMFYVSVGGPCRVKGLRVLWGHLAVHTAILQLKYGTKICERAPNTQGK